MRLFFCTLLSFTVISEAYSQEMIPGYAFDCQLQLYQGELVVKETTTKRVKIPDMLIEMDRATFEGDLLKETFKLEGIIGTIKVDAYTTALTLKNDSSEFLSTMEFPTGMIVPSRKYLRPFRLDYYQSESGNIYIFKCQFSSGQ